MRFCLCNSSTCTSYMLHLYFSRFYNGRPKWLTPIIRCIQGSRQVIASVVHYWHKAKHELDRAHTKDYSFCWLLSTWFFTCFHSLMERQPSPRGRNCNKMRFVFFCFARKYSLRVKLTRDLQFHVQSVEPLEPNWGEHLRVILAQHTANKGELVVACRMRISAEWSRCRRRCCRS